MRTVRRLYFYAVSLVSLEVVLWGLIGLVRSTITPDVVGGGPARLAQALSLILVGVPVFWIHWNVAQRNAREDMDEHASGVRAFFLYATLLAILIPIVQNLLGLVNHIVLRLFLMSNNLTMFSRGQVWTDNLVAILMNGLVAVYFIRILRQDWETVTSSEALSNQRRLYRTIWVVYALVLLVAGVQQMLRFVLSMPASTMFGPSTRVSFTNGLSLLLVGTPLFYFAWQTAQNALKESHERESLLRLGLLYVLALSGVITVLSTGGVVVNVLLRLVLGEKMGLSAFMGAISTPLSLGIPLAGVWAYFGHWLNRSMTEVPDAPRRAGLRRFYYYILSAIGLVATFIGLSLLLSFIIDNLVGGVLWTTTLRPRLASALAVMLVSFPLWWLTWRPMQADALQAGDDGDHARRSLMRKIYLYLVMFASVIGGMVVTGSMLFLLLRSLLGDIPSNLLRDVLNYLQLLLLFVLLGVYHGLTLRRDGQRAAEALNQKHAAFPVLLLDPGDTNLVQELQATLGKQLPSLPLQVHSATQPLSMEQQTAFKAVLLPASVALQPPKALADWLTGFDGAKLVLPSPVPGWVWSGVSGHSSQEMYRQTAQILRQLAEGQEIRSQASTSGWMIAFYILLGLIITPILLSLLGSVIFR
ncbi:MAG: hypothetical protein A2X25_15140 [Chloroflexi bacterium GWB2_49_20]|nr:MAG: hypothetical protein A2X25_15140 [Chloroflexi bacterium GWB2_49_20]OGN80394.1 MAG: hypothetical protein A2X26_13905 [Chloroflexi bacterium GWC2_49_37]OGN84292.1 MAG: hypothetical protein A2X27_12685 [Chloroflexi bacterium GWD2_49_16]